MDSIIQKTNKLPKIPIVIATCSIIIVIITLRWFVKRNNQLTSLVGIAKNAKNKIIVKSNKLKNHMTNTGLNWSICFWIYIDDLNYKFNKQKHILKWNNCNIWLSKTNNLYITLEKYNNKQSKIIYERIPIQKWLHISVIYEDRHLDLWINGKLYSSIFLDNLQKFDKNSEMIICPEGGFSGYISKFNYYNYAIKRKAVLNIDSVYMQYYVTPFYILLKIPIIGHLFRLIAFLYKIITNLPFIKPIIKLLTNIYKLFINLICNINSIIKGIFGQTDS